MKDKTYFESESEFELPEEYPQYHPFDGETIDSKLTPKQVKNARERSCKSDRLNTIYFILKEIKGRENAKHAKEIIQIANDEYHIPDITVNDITECVNRLVEKNFLPDIQSEKRKGYYRATNRTEFKIGLYEIVMNIKGYLNRWDNRRECYCKMFGYGEIPDDPLDYKDEIGAELNESEEL